MGKKKQKKKDEYYAYLGSNAWHKIRREALELADWTCQRCGVSRKKGLHVHHKTYKNFKHESLEDLEVLCEKCHKEHHSHRDKRREITNKRRREKRQEKKKKKKSKNGKQRVPPTANPKGSRLIQANELLHERQQAAKERRKAREDRESWGP